MKKYKLLKDLPFFKKWTIFLFDWTRAYEGWNEEEVVHHPFNDCSFNDLLWEWYEEIRDEEIPKFKIGENVVYDDFSWTIRFQQVRSIHYDTGGFNYNWYFEEFLRRPTQEELDKYYL